MEDEGEVLSGQTVSHLVLILWIIFPAAAPPKGKADHSEGSKTSHFKAFGPKRQVKCG